MEHESELLYLQILGILLEFVTALINLTYCSSFGCGTYQCTITEELSAGFSYVPRVSLKSQHSNSPRASCARLHFLWRHCMQQHAMVLPAWCSWPKLFSSVFSFVSETNWFLLFSFHLAKLGKIQFLPLRFCIPQGGFAFCVFKIQKFSTSPALGLETHFRFPQ